jgi:hypothetical protein
MPMTHLRPATETGFRSGPSMPITMPMWAWIVTGAFAVVAASSVVGLVVAAILGGISRDVSQLLEAESWASAPLKQGRRTAAKA